MLLIVGSALCGKKYFSAETPQENPTPFAQEDSSAPSAQESLTKTRLLYYSPYPLTVDEWVDKLGGISNIAKYIITDDVPCSLLPPFYACKGVYCRKNSRETVTITMGDSRVLRNSYCGMFRFFEFKTGKIFKNFYGTYFEIVLSKFLTDGKNTLESLTPETEAKIFFILSKIIPETTDMCNIFGDIDPKKVPSISTYLYK